MALSDQRIESIVREVMKHITVPASDAEACAPGQETTQSGVFDTIEQAIEAAKVAQAQLAATSLERRGVYISAMRRAAARENVKLAKMANAETGFGRVEDKILKNTLAIDKTPGIEDLSSQAFTGDNGLTLVEEAPFGVIGAITPSTNPTSTVINNAISMIAAGNAVVFCPHPGARQCSTYTMSILNDAIMEMDGPANLLTTVSKPSMETSKVVMTHPDIKMLAVTGGEAVVKVAMRCGKKVIAAGPGNPPVVVDDTAYIKKAAADIVAGCSFDNNVLCIAEKEIFVFESVADELIRHMQSNGAYLLQGREIEKVRAMTIVQDKEGNVAPNKKFVGKNADFILAQAGISGGEGCRVAMAEVDADHDFVQAEMLMPVLAVVRVRDLDEAIERSLQAEHGYHHTAIMHSQHVSNMTRVAQAMDTTIFVKNAPSYAGLGFEGEGFTTLTIATPTGEGLTSARSFTRKRRCALHGSFRII